MRLIFREDISIFMCEIVWIPWNIRVLNVRSFFIEDLG